MSGLVIALTLPSPKGRGKMRVEETSCEIVLDK